MPRDGKTYVGEVLHDWTQPPGTRLVVLAVTSGQLPTPIDPRLPYRGSQAERCAMYGGTAQWKSKEPTK